MARIVTIINTLLFLFLVWGCAWPNKKEVQAPRASEPTPAAVSSTPMETTSDRMSSATTAARTTVSKEEIRMLQARLKAAGFYMGPVDGIAGRRPDQGCFGCKQRARTSKTFWKLPRWVLKQ
jgi:hypothetical protein